MAFQTERPDKIARRIKGRGIFWLPIMGAVPLGRGCGNRFRLPQNDHSLRSGWQAIVWLSVTIHSGLESVACLPEKVRMVQAERHHVPHPHRQRGSALVRAILPTFRTSDAKITIFINLFNINTLTTLIISTSCKQSVHARLEFAKKLGIIIVCVITCTKLFRSMCDS
jgi:hypothetical protein